MIQNRGRMRKIPEKSFIEKIESLVERANFRLEPGIYRFIAGAAENETVPDSVKVLKIILENIAIAGKKHLPICQDTGMVEVFLEIGNNIFIDLKRFSSLQALVDAGVRSVYEKHFLRKSVVTPLERKNTGTNVPSVIWTDIVRGAKIEISVMIKGFGSENTTQLKMFRPSAGIEEIEDFVVETVRTAGPNACPPVFAGIGIGGTADKAVFLSKKALVEVWKKSDPDTESLGKRLKNSINRLGIGPAGFGGRHTCLAVKPMMFPTHIAGLPVAVSLSCWAHRAAKGVI